MDNDDFSALTIPQLTSHCGPCSLSYCLYMLGIEATQEELTKAAGMSSWKLFRGGMDERRIMRVAARYRIGSRELAESDYAQGARFAAKLRAHLEQEHPAILLTYDNEHWVSCLGVTDGKFVIADPDNDDQAYELWSERTLLSTCWNEPDDEEEPDQFYAILLKRKDGKPCRWKLTADWLKLVARGSEESLQKLAEDVSDVALRAGGTRDGKGKLDLAAVLREYEDTVCQDVGFWVGDDVEVRDLRRVYRDLCITAESLRLKVTKTVNRYSLVAAMTAMLTVYAWRDEL